MRVEKDFEELLELFNKNKVRYCIIGAFAVGFYAKPRYTKDMDVFIEPSRENAKRIIKSLDDFGFKVLDLQEGDFSQKNRVVQLGYEPVRIDIITSIQGCSFKEVWKNKKKAKYGEQKVYFIGLRELIKNKNSSERKQDKLDLQYLKAVRRRKL